MYAGQSSRSLLARAFARIGRGTSAAGAPLAGGAVEHRQREALAAFAEIDHAVLSSAGTDRIVRTLLRVAPGVIGCESFGVTVLPSDSQPQARTLIADARGEPVEHRPAAPSPVLHALSSSTGGCWVDDPAADPIARPLADLGARRVLLLPVFVDAALAAVLVVGLHSRAHLPDTERTYAGDFAARLGVALTASVHRESRYVETHFDSLTGLPNRRSLTERLIGEIARAQREKLRFALMFINIDDFKKVNDCAGYSGGDSVLREAAARLKRSFREQDVLARHGADEFLVLLPSTPSGLHAQKAAEKVAAVLSEPFIVGDEKYHLGASIGISLFPDDGGDSSRLLHNADIAMSRAKTQGSGRIMFYEERINAELFSRAALERDLRQAVHGNELTVAYQPMVELKSGKVVGAEALLRWQHPQRGAVGPHEFIGIAEQSALIEQIGDYVRQTVCRQYQTWLANGVAPSRISLNVSSREVQREDFAAQIEALLEETGMRPFCLELEITESLLVDNSSTALATVQRLHDRGVRIAIDDFGTGYSSLAYLQRLPFDVLKIDRAFIAGIGRDHESDSILSAIVAVAQSLGKEIVAEGIETEQQREVLAGHGVEIGQGYLWSPATAPEHYAKLMGGAVYDAQWRAA